MEENCSAPDLSNLHRELTCILFPALVKNDDKALQCMGGIKAISQMHSQSNKKRLGMSFQYDNPFIKKMYADAKSVSGVVLRIKVKKSKSGNEVKREVVSTNVLGSVKKIYKFESMSDFQYLPVAPSVAGGNQFKCILEDILPSGLDHFKTVMNPTPTFILPANFTRSDKTINYYYTDRRYAVKDIKSEPSIQDEGLDTHRMLRCDRSVPVVKYIFNLTDELPTEPNEYYIQQKNAKLASHPQLEMDYEVIKKMFEERPIWSMNHIRYRTKMRINLLKVILPCIALYIREGPWRMMWVKYGYDPRKDPESRKYQTLDFRLRHAAGVHTMVVARDESVHVKKTDRIRTFKKINVEDQATEDISESTVCFRPGTILTQRQIFYQYCDIHLPEVQAALAVAAGAGAGAGACHPKLGWLPPELDDACRDHVFRYAKQALLATHNADLKLEQVGSDEDLSSDDEASNSMIIDGGETSNISNEPSSSAGVPPPLDGSLPQ